jgi:hypothetical protein
MQLSTKYFFIANSLKIAGFISQFFNGIKFICIAVHDLVNPLNQTLWLSIQEVQAKKLKKLCTRKNMVS